MTLGRATCYLVAVTPVKITRILCMPANPGLVTPGGLVSHAAGVRTAQRMSTPSLMIFFIGSNEP